MMDRRGFLAAMLGATVAPKDVLAGIATPAPIKEASQRWVAVFTIVSRQSIKFEDGSVHISECRAEFSVPAEIADDFKALVERDKVEVKRLR